MQHRQRRRRRRQQLLLAQAVIVVAVGLVAPAAAQVISSSNNNCTGDGDCPRCADLVTPTSCCDDPLCGWCAATYTCVAGNELGPTAPEAVPCDCTSWCGGANSYEDCRAANSAVRVALDTLAAANPTVSVPADRDIRCLNGGQRHWFNNSACQSPCVAKNPDVPVFGNAKCECPDDWVGVDCGLCTLDAQCPGDDQCNRFINPEASTITAELLAFGERRIGCVRPPARALLFICFLFLVSSPRPCFAGVSCLSRLFVLIILLLPFSTCAHTCLNVFAQYYINCAPRTHPPPCCVDLTATQAPC